MDVTKNLEDIRKLLNLIYGEVNIYDSLANDNSLYANFDLRKKTIDEIKNILESNDDFKLLKVQFIALYDSLTGTLNRAQNLDDMKSELWSQLSSKLLKFYYSAKTFIPAAPLSGWTDHQSDLINQIDRIEGILNKELSVLTLQLEFPEDISNSELLEIVKKSVAHLDSVHRSFGGNGLKVEDLELASIYSLETVS